MNLKTIKGINATKDLNSIASLLHLSESEVHAIHDTWLREREGKKGTFQAYLRKYLRRYEL